MTQAVKGLDTSSGDRTVLVPPYWASSGPEFRTGSVNHTELSSTSVLLWFRNNYLPVLLVLLEDIRRYTQVHSRVYKP